MTSVRDFEVAEQYPSRTARSPSGSSTLISAMRFPLLFFMVVKEKTPHPERGRAQSAELHRREGESCGLLAVLTTAGNAEIFGQGEDLCIAWVWNLPLRELGQPRVIEAGFFAHDRPCSLTAFEPIFDNLYGVHFQKIAKFCYVVKQKANLLSDREMKTYKKIRRVFESK